jgi:hypothetical protein
VDIPAREFMRVQRASHSAWTKVKSVTPVKFSERILRVILWFLVLDAAVGGAVLLFGGRAAFAWAFPHLPGSEMTDLLLFKQRTWGGLGVALTIMLIAAARDPRANAIVVWGMAAGLAMAGLAELSSIWLLDVARLFPIVTIVVHSLARIGIALVLVFLEKRLLAKPSHTGSA